MRLRCVKCGTEAEIKFGPEYEYVCKSCGFKYIIELNKIRYDFEALLYEKFGERYLLNSVLNNNAKISYELFKEGNVSVSGREDVSRFKDFAAKHVSGQVVLDIGCGSGEFPEYLSFKDERSGFIGLDPCVISGKDGILVAGAAEFLPLASDTVDSIVAATSLDHLVSIKTAVSEFSRVLKPGGSMVIWMSDRSFSLKERLNNWISVMTDSFKSPQAFMSKLKETAKRALSVFPGKKVMSKLFWKVFKKEFSLPVVLNGRVGKFKVINGVPFYTPRGTKDPFHSFNGSPKTLRKYFEKDGFILKEYNYMSRSEVHFSFMKKT